MQDTMTQIHKDGTRACYWTDMDGNMLVFHQPGEYVLLVGDEEDTPRFKIPGYLIQCEVIKQRHAITGITPIKDGKVGASFDRLHLAKGDDILDYLRVHKAVELL